MKFITTSIIAAVLATGAAADGWKDDYQVVKFGILSGENEKDRLMRNEPLRVYLEEALGVKVEIFTAGNYDGVIPTLTTIKADGNTGYNSIVVTRCDSGIKSLEDAAGKVHAFADPDSTSGYAVPYWNMVNKEGFVPEEYFGTVTFSGSHEAGVQGVVNGTFDTASTYQSTETNNVFTRMENKGMIEEGVVCKIWTSPEITSGPWTFRSNLPADMIEEITQAIEAFPTADEEGYKLYSSFDPEDENPSVGFARVDTERYQWIVDMRQWIKEQRRKG